MRGRVTNTGYLDNSPDRFNDYNVIPGPSITMDGVSKPILMFPIKNNRVGNPVQGIPGENYYFPEAQGVVEMPLPQGNMSYERMAKGGSSEAKMRDILSKVAYGRGGSTMTPELAAKILKTGSIYGKSITSSQRSKFAELAAEIGIDENGDPIEKNKDTSEDVEEYRRGGSLPKAKKKHSKTTSKNIYTAINELFTRNTMLYGSGGKEFYKPELKHGGWLDKYQDGGEDPYYNMERALELGYEPDETGHWPSVDYETGDYLKSKKHDTAWKEYLYGYIFNPEQALNYDVRVNPEGYFGEDQLQYVPKKKYGGWLDALPKAQAGLDNILPLNQKFIFKREDLDPDSPAYIQALQQRAAGCHKGECLEGANTYYNRFVAPMIGMPNTWKTNELYGIISGDENQPYGTTADSWELAALQQAKGAIQNYAAPLYDKNKVRNFEREARLNWEEISPADKQKLYSGMALGTLVNYGDYGEGHEERRSAANEQAGLYPSRHSARVIGYTEDGMPVVYDYGKIKPLDQSGLGHPITNITTPKEYSPYNYEYVKKWQEKRKPQQYNPKEKLYLASKNIRKGESDVEYDEAEFVEGINSNIKKLMEITGASQEDIIKAGKVAFGIMQGETRGGRGSAYAKLKEFGKAITPFTEEASKGYTRMKKKMLAGDETNTYSQYLEALGLNPTKMDLWDPKVAGLATTALILSRKGEMEGVDKWYLRAQQHNQPSFGKEKIGYLKQGDADYATNVINNTSRIFSPKTGYGIPETQKWLSEKQNKAKETKKEITELVRQENLRKQKEAEQESKTPFPIRVSLPSETTNVDISSKYLTRYKKQGGWLDTYDDGGQTEDPRKRMYEEAAKRKSFYSIPTETTQMFSRPIEDPVEKAAVISKGQANKQRLIEQEKLKRKKELEQEAKSDSWWNKSVGAKPTADEIDYVATRAAQDKYAPFWESDLGQTIKELPYGLAEEFLPGALPGFINKFTKTPRMAKNLYKDIPLAPVSPLANKEPSSWVKPSKEKIKDLYGFLDRRQFLKELQKKGLVGEDFNLRDINYTATSTDRTNALTKLALDRHHGGFRLTSGTLPPGGKGRQEYTGKFYDMSRPAYGQKVSEFENMANAGVDLSDPKSIAEYQASHIPMEDYGYRSTGESPTHKYGFIFNSSSPYLSPDPDYGTFQFKKIPKTNYDQGNYLDWYKQYYSEQPFHAVNDRPLLDSPANYVVVPWRKNYPGTMVGPRGVKAYEIDKSFPFTDMTNLTSSQKEELKKYVENYQKKYLTGWRGEYKTGGWLDSYQ